VNYCSNCGAPVVYRTPPGDDRPRFLCESCGTVHYENPRLVVGCIPVWENRILFCRRAIEPRCGKWTIPAGFLENGETVAEGAARETYEEARARVKALTPYFMVDLTFIQQVYLIFTGRLVDGTYEAGEESLEVRLFRESEIPWDELAFPVIWKSLKSYVADSATGRFTFHTSSMRKRSVGQESA
jgi:ADP-ribose pyrophosphatase YjhB (NUDIX family)